MKAHKVYNTPIQLTKAKGIEREKVTSDKIKTRQEKKRFIDALHRLALVKSGSYRFTLDSCKNKGSLSPLMKSILFSDPTKIDSQPQERILSHQLLIVINTSH